MLSMLKTWSSSKSIKALFIVATLWSCTGVQAQNPKEEPMVYQLQSDGQEWSPVLDGNLKLRLSASQAEVFVNYLVWDMIQLGLLRLYTPIGNYFQGSELTGFDSINLEHLMTHTSGYPEGSDRTYLGQSDPKDYARPGEKYQPCPLNRYLIDKIMSIRGGRSQAKWFEEKMIVLGLNDTKLKSNGSIETTVKDLGIWLKRWLDKDLLPKELIQYFFKPQVQSEGKLYSYGWEITAANQLLSWQEGEPIALVIDANTNKALFISGVKDINRDQLLNLVNEHVETTSFRVWHLVFLLPLLLIVLLRKRKNK